MEVRYFVHYHPLVVRDDIPKLDAATRLRVKNAIEKKLMTHPDLFGAPLRRSRKGHRKLRVGDYRAVFRLTDDTVYILAIQHRSMVYKRPHRRI